MPNINYETKELLPNIYVVVAPNKYTRAMLFLRIQEFYESKNKKFRGKKFSFWDYKEWYSSLNKENFTYPSDWAGFNVPLKIALKCKKISQVETPYDLEMNKILDSISKTARVEKSYLIGVDSTKSSTFKHELAHALYYTNKEYKNIMDEITKSINTKKFNVLKNKLKKLGYCDRVIKDEIQAYLSTEPKVLAKGTSIKENLIKQYKNNFIDQYIRLKI